MEGLKRRTENGRFAFDSYRRFIQMFGNVVLEISKDVFEHELDAVKQSRATRLDTDLDEAALREVVVKYKDVVKKKTGREFPQDPTEQLKMARNAVFRSWMNPRAKEYRRIYDIPDHIGTAVNVQMMVFGNTGNRSGTGVGFTRNPATGKKEFYGEFLINAQGEDVVAGIRTPQPITELGQVMPKAYKQLREITTRLEKHYKDVQDFEFTIQDERLFMLQTRSGKRTGYAGVVIATDLVAEKLITPKEAVLLVDPGSLGQLLTPGFDQTEWKKIETATKGLPASPGAACGHVVFSADQAVSWSQQGKPVILVRRETVPDDIHGMFVAQGILTATGGMTSHAAVVGRQMGKPSIVGAGQLEIDESAKVFRVAGHTVKEGDYISFDGLTGEVKLARVASKPSEILQVIDGSLDASKSDIYRRFEKLLSWADGFRRLGIRANADLPDQAAIAYFTFGARGIGLCRTEHMFFGEGRIPIVQRMILSETEADRRQALDELLPLQRADFYGVFKEMRGTPVTIRTIDPPLQSSCPSARSSWWRSRSSKWTAGSIRSSRRSASFCCAWSSCTSSTPCSVTAASVSGSPVHGRSPRCRRARSWRPPVSSQGKGLTVVPEIMIPLVGLVKELRDQRAIVDRVAAETMKAKGVTIGYLVGTMIELPRGAVTADKIAEVAQFFSFGTNDLTQLTFGFSRDDVGKFLKEYLEKKILEKDPFVSIDVEGVGQLVKIGIELGRKTKKDLKIGICGEHGGDPASIHFFHNAGMDYVSASPYRIPVARLAAAQAALAVKVGD